MRKNDASGFTVVEVLISLFIAGILLAGAYQVYSVVISSTREARERAVASGYAHEVLQYAKSYLPATSCSPVSSTTIPSSWVTMPSTINVSSRSYTVTCPYGTSNSISTIHVSIKYGSPEREVVHAAYAEKP